MNLALEHFVNLCMQTTNRNGATRQAFLRKNAETGEHEFRVDITDEGYQTAFLVIGVLANVFLQAEEVNPDLAPQHAEQAAADAEILTQASNILYDLLNGEGRAAGLN